MFANALKVAPPEAQWPTVLRTQLEHAREIATAHAEELDAFLAHSIVERLHPLPPSLAARWREAASILAGKTKPYHAVVNQLCVPRLPAVPFFDRELFPFLAELETKTAVIRARARSGARVGSRSLRPVHSVRAGPAGESVGGAQSLALAGAHCTCGATESP